MAKKGVLTTADYLPYEEYKAVLNRLHEDKNYFYELYFIVSFSTALRVSDVLSIRWGDILGKQCMIKVEKKTGKTRKIRFNDTVQNKVKELYKLMGEPSVDSFLFGNKERAITPQNINLNLKKIRNRYSLSITNFSTHTFRKTFGRYVYNSKGNTEGALLLLCSIFNHSNPSVTIRYIGIRQDEIDEVFDCIEF